jgi:hypothetical protein
MTTNGLSKEPMAYIATKDCGCMVSSMLKDAVEKKVLGKLIAEWVAAGYNIEFVAHSYVLTNWHLCGHGHKQQELSEQAKRNAELAAKAAAEVEAKRFTQLTYMVAEDGTVGEMSTSVNGSGPHTDLKPSMLFEGTKQLLLEGYLLFTDGVEIEEDKVGMYRAHAHWTGKESGYLYRLDAHFWDNEGETWLYEGTVEQHDEEQFLTDMVNIAPLIEWHVEQLDSPSAIEPSESQPTDEVSPALATEATEPTE